VTGRIIRRKALTRVELKSQGRSLPYSILGRRFSEADSTNQTNWTNILFSVKNLQINSSTMLKKLKSKSREKKKRKKKKESKESITSFFYQKIQGQLCKFTNARNPTIQSTTQRAIPCTNP